MQVWRLARLTASDRELPRLAVRPGTSRARGLNGTPGDGVGAGSRILTYERSQWGRAAESSPPIASGLAEVLVFAGNHAGLFARARRTYARRAGARAVLEPPCLVSHIHGGRNVRIVFRVSERP